MMDNRHILIVDDERAILKGFQAILEMTGYRVSIAENGEEALDMACERFYNLALIDIKLPDMEGTELLRELQHINPEMKKVMVTGYASLENAIESVNLGADGYLVKPVMPGVLLEVVAEKLRDQEAEEERHAELVRELPKANRREGYSRDKWA
jgi:DNA-binding NtrC family response regulator